jgi:hypothetical protein
MTPLQKQQLGAFLSRPLIDPRVANEAPPFDRPSLHGESALVREVLAGGALGSSGAAPRPIALDPPLLGKDRFTVGAVGALVGVAASPSFRMQLFGPHDAASPAAVDDPAPRALRVYGSEPNPFRGGTTLRYDLATSSKVRLTVYDVTGRAVRRLVDTFAAPGRYSATWDGTRDDGQPVAAGMYFYRLETDHGGGAARVVRLQ